MNEEFLSNQIRSLISDHKILVLAGNGGVGKTTMASILGYCAAETGLKTLVMTIDPSRRLASTLGIKMDGEVHKVDGDLELYASVLNAGKVFDQFLRRHVGDEQKIEKLKRNILFKQLTGDLSGSQEFTSVESLLCHYEEGEYDLIILDTPPSSHALDFLEAPYKISQLFDQSTTKWLRSGAQDGGFIGGILNRGTHQVLKILDKLTGEKFISELQSFFDLVFDWQDEIYGRALKVHDLLHSDVVSFVLVSSLDEIRLHEAMALARALEREGHLVNGLIINRSRPAGLAPYAKSQEGLLGGVAKDQWDRYTEAMSYFKENIATHVAGKSIVFVDDIGKSIHDVQGIKEICAQF